MAADLSGSVGEIADVIRAMFGLTRRNRARDQLLGTIELYRAMQELEGIDHARGHIAALINSQSERLKLVHNERRHDWNWGSFVFAFILACLAGWGAWALWPPSLWWTLTLFALDVTVGGLMFIASFGVLLQNTDDT